MPFEAMSLSSDSQNLPPLQCSPDERPPLLVTSMGQGYLDEELDTARIAWYRAVALIPYRPGIRRTNALKRAQTLQREYERLLGHTVPKMER